MRFYQQQHPFYCGIDLHARSLYVCIINEQGKTLVHQNIKDSPDDLHLLLEPYIGNVVVGVECMHCWYWVADWCEQHHIDFILGHALYMRAIHGGKAKNDKIDSYKIASLIRGGNFPLAYAYPKAMRPVRDLLRRRSYFVHHCAELQAHIKNTASQYNLDPVKASLRYANHREALDQYFPNRAVQTSVDMNLQLIDQYQNAIHKMEWFVLSNTKKTQAKAYRLLTTVHGIGKVLALTILLEIGDIARFPTVKHFASYARLVKCKADSAGKSYGTQGSKIGNVHLKWAFSEAAVLFLKGNPPAQKYLARLQKRMGKAKALSALAHKLGRCVYFMLRNNTVFDEQRILGQ